MFVDEVKVQVTAGDGGRGCVSFRREKYVPKGGPDGGDGGNGGSVTLRVTSNLTTLLDLASRHHISAERGVDGKGKKMHGRSGESVVIEVPPGTEVRDVETGELLTDLTDPGEEWVAAHGGRGGRGNARFATPTDRAPRRADPGLPGERRLLRLTLKILADVGIVGFPNAGKSTLISMISAAHPKTGPYPFTTLTPQLGMVRPEEGKPFLAADLPGLIEGAHLGLGLGIRFLRHIQRTKVILHVVDVSPASGRDPVDDWKAIDAELTAYDPALAGRPRVTVANKMDVEGSKERLAALRRFCRRRKIPCLPISALTGKGLPALVQGLVEVLEQTSRAVEE